MTTNKRTLLHAGLTATAALAAEATGLAAAAKAEETPSVAGDAVTAAAEDFGHLIHRKPQTVLKPASAADIAELMPWAASRGLKVAARGQGHSVFGRAMVEGGVVLDMTSMRTIHDVQPDRISVDAGATWSAVLDAALSHGLTPPVLTNYLELSVGGTLAVGGIGPTTFRYGMQTDNVLDLDVVTGDGRQLTCSPNSNPDLFDAIRAGLGQCGIITRATLRLVPAPQQVRRFSLFYTDLRSLTADQRTVLTDGRFDQLQGAILPDGAGAWRYQLESAVHYDGHAAPDNDAVLAGLSDERSAAVMSDLTYIEDLSAFVRLESLLRSNGHWFHPHPWLLTFLRGSNAEQLAGDILAGLTNGDVGPFGRITYYPMTTKALRTPLVRMPDESIAFPFNLIRIPASKDATKAEHMVISNRALYERLRDAGSVLYPVSAFPMSQNDWKDHFGPRWSLLHDAKQRYDPLATLTPGYTMF
ncbi:FAD-binding protein [Rhizobium leguminosarum]|uniref:FAD-binding protein n=1 Tax=Rhizobium leguminosarum TaxID=384 RepID=UPI001FF03BA7|nr:FAD-binding protein [Rhizobium leguminosarum]